MRIHVTSVPPKSAQRSISASSPFPRSSSSVLCVSNTTAPRAVASRTVSGQGGGRGISLTHIFIFEGDYFSFPKALDLSFCMDGGTEAPERICKFELFGVVTHCGRDANFGHYTATLKNLFLPSDGPVSCEEKEEEKSVRKNEEDDENKEIEGEGERERERESREDGKETAEEEWYDFNDTHVKAVTSASLSSLFAGHSSAYMLLYRNAALGRVTLPTVPPHLLSDNNIEEEEQYEGEISGPLVPIWKLTILFPTSIKTTRSGAKIVTLDPLSFHRSEISKVRDTRCICVCVCVCVRFFVCEERRCVLAVCSRVAVLCV